MTSRAQPSRKRAGAARHRSRRWVPWAALGLLVVFLLFFAVAKASPELAASVQPARLWARLTGRVGPHVAEPLSLTVVHSNDTYGYFLPCG